MIEGINKMPIKDVELFNEIIDFPWVMRSKLFIRLIGLAACIACLCLASVSFTEKGVFLFEDFILISIGALTLLGTIRSVRCSSEGITIMKGVIWSETVLWENIQKVQMGQIIEHGDTGNALIPYYYLSITTKSYKSFSILLHWFRKNDVELLIRILKGKSVPFPDNICRVSKP
jgi:hypothetical protein